jgi:cation diffusion facilitator CzcD-associated flavoprotein CzcO
MADDQVPGGRDGRDLEMAIVGAGFAGLQMLHRALQRGRRVVLFEAGSGVGGTWHWNRYPGARVDLESLEYSLSFSKELEQDWEWSERYAGQPELERYLDHVADRFGLRPHIRFDTRIVAAHFDEDRHHWDLRTQTGEAIRAKFCVMATGLLSAPNRPDIAGRDDFAGVQVQTGLWPKQGVALENRRVGVIGTGSSAVQCIPEIAKQASHLTVFQRTPVFAIPARNRPTDPAEQARIKAEYARLRELEAQSLAGFVSLEFLPDPHPRRAALQVSAEERKAEYDRRWAAGGLCFYNAFTDLLLNQEANETLAEYVRQKIRERVKDPATAEKLIPRDYAILTKRLCAESGYYETYNRDNVSLVDLRQTPIQRIEADGIRTADGQLHACDVLVWATGFDAMTGALDRIDIRGRGGRSIREHWGEGLRTFAGLMCAGFPNMIFMNGPGSPSAFFAPIQLAEYQADWIERTLDALAARGLDCIEPTHEAEEEWVAHSDAVAAHTLLPSTRSWYMGDNIPGKPRRILIYLGGFPAYREACENGAANGYQKFRLGRASASIA